MEILLSTVLILVAVIGSAIAATWKIRGKISDAQEPLLKEMTTIKNDLTVIKSDLAVHRHEETRVREYIKELRGDIKTLATSVAKIQQQTTPRN